MVARCLLLLRRSLPTTPLHSRLSPSTFRQRLPCSATVRFFSKDNDDTSKDKADPSRLNLDRLVDDIKKEEETASIKPVASASSPSKPPSRTSATAGSKGKLPSDSKEEEQHDDPFGVHFEDGNSRLGPHDDMPPQFIRDAATGQFTDAVQPEMTEAEQRFLKADLLEKEAHLDRRITQHWQKQDTDSDERLDDLAERIRDAELGTNVLGRSVKAQFSTEQMEDGSDQGRDEETGFAQKLTPQEFQAFSKYMKEQHEVEVSSDDLPVQDAKTSRPSQRHPTSPENDPDDGELSQKWLTSHAQRQLDDTKDDDPYADLLPHQLSPRRLVNRKEGKHKQLPVEWLHHNNIELIRRYTTPTGLIMRRVQSRLSARDQRRVAQLVRRARALGLIPYRGQFKPENHGWIHSPDLDEEREWEQELKGRGLVIKRQQQQQLQAENRGEDKSTSRSSDL